MQKSRSVCSALLAVAVLTALAAATTADAAMPALLWNLTHVKSSLGSSWTYEDEITVYAAQGLANRHESRVFYDTGADDYDWPHAELHWVELLQNTSRASFTNVDPSFCALLNATRDAVSGLVAYDGDDPLRAPYGDGFSAAISLTLAGQRSLLPVSASQISKHERCLKNLSLLPPKQDLRILLANKTRIDAWEWAIESLLPNSSKKTVFNLNHYRVVGKDPTGELFDKQSRATAASIDYIVQQNAFVLDLEAHTDTGSSASKHVTPPLLSTAPQNEDDQLLQRIFRQLDPLFDAFGWANDEFAWTNATSRGGGTVFCSFASPNLSWWSLFPLPDGVDAPRKLPENDAGVKLNRSKYYVTFETNEGDTPRILVSSMASAWTKQERGSLPVAWAIDPVLAERFPALWDHFASTATANDSFIAGTAGAGYAYLNQMSSDQVERYGERVGLLTAKFGPHVFDTYGYANVSTHDAYAKAAAKAGGAAAAFVTQPNWAEKAYSPFHCPKRQSSLGRRRDPPHLRVGGPKALLLLKIPRRELPEL